MSSYVKDYTTEERQRKRDTFCVCKCVVSVCERERDSFVRISADIMNDMIMYSISLLVIIMYGVLLCLPIFFNRSEQTIYFYQWPINIGVLIS